MPDLTSQDTPPQSGRTVVITGATSGLGYETALALAAADVTLTGRNPVRAEAITARLWEASSELTGTRWRWSEGYPST